MDFTFSEEQELLRQAVKDWVDGELRPLAAQIDREKKVPDRILDQIRELGFLGIPFPEEYGGGGWGKSACASSWRRSPGAVSPPR